MNESKCSLHSFSKALWFPLVAIPFWSFLKRVIERKTKQSAISGNFEWVRMLRIPISPWQQHFSYIHGSSFDYYLWLDKGSKVAIVFDKGTDNIHWWLRRSGEKIPLSQQTDQWQLQNVKDKQGFPAKSSSYCYYKSSECCHQSSIKIWLEWN